MCPIPDQYSPKVKKLQPVLWIRDIFVRIRILLFSSGTFKMQKKLVFKYFAYYFLKVHLRVHHFSKIKSHQKEVTKNSRNQKFFS